MIKAIISKRKLVQALLAGILLFFIYYFEINLLYIILLGGFLGIVFGKVFCRWMCPLGFLVELMFSKVSGDEKNQQMYNYHKLGCPIAWISGFLNRFSLFKVRIDSNSCVSCGKCDKACYIASLNKGYSLYEKGKSNPSSHFSCSKCLECVKECPTDSLKYKIK